MTFKDFKTGMGEFFTEFGKQKAGLVGAGILLLAILMVIFQPLLSGEYSDVEGNWRNIAYWEDGSPAAKPVWTNLFASKKAAPGMVLEEFELVDGRSDSFRTVTYSFVYNYKHDVAPLDIIFRAVGYGTAALELTITRPDGVVLVLPGVVEQNMDKSDYRYSVETRARNAMVTWARRIESEENLRLTDTRSVRPPNVIFAKAEPGILRAPVALKGEYKFTMTMSSNEPNARLEEPHLIMVGRVSGIMGTDTNKRDIWVGLVAGMKWALLIGIITSAISVLIGVFYGIITAYFGGKVDYIMSFIFEIFISMPVLPILIVLSATLSPSIWNIIGALVVFSWVGPVKTVRSMALQIKEETYIEAAKALGASHFRIIFKHMAPLLLPYSFAMMALSVPGAIIYEASLSLLGLGDPSIISWGQLLQGAVNGGAVLNGLWWWVVPPGLAIAIMGMTFAFLGQALDKILHPKLKTR
ncbi:MAG: ABC transporter permease [Spirochaetes bacterium]|nr:ABC transporter permease [Spirochaetota bacterium]